MAMEVYSLLRIQKPGRVQDPMEHKTNCIRPLSISHMVGGFDKRQSSFITAPTSSSQSPKLRLNENVLLRDGASKFVIQSLVIDRVSMLLVFCENNKKRRVPR